MSESTSSSSAKDENYPPSSLLTPQMASLSMRSRSKAGLHFVMSNDILHLSRGNSARLTDVDDFADDFVEFESDTLVSRLNMLANEDVVTADHSEQLQAAYPSSNDLQSMSAEELREMVTREREEHLNKVVVADSHTHRVRRHAEKLHHSVDEMFRQCTKLDVFGERLKMITASFEEDNISMSAPLQLEAIKDTIELFCEEFAAIKSAAMEANQRNSDLQQQCDALKLRLVEQFNSISAVPSPSLYVRRSRLRTQSHSTEEPSKTNVPLDYASDTPSKSLSKTRQTSKLSFFTTAEHDRSAENARFSENQRGEFTESEYLDVTTTRATVELKSDHQSDSESDSELECQNLPINESSNNNRLINSDTTFLKPKQSMGARINSFPSLHAPTGHVVGELDYLTMKKKIVFMQAIVRGWLERRNFKKIRRRLLVLRELVVTERSYVEDLRALVQLYMHPLQKSTKLAISPQEIRNVFSSIEVIFLYNESFLAELFHRKATSSAKSSDFCVGDAFLALGDFLRSYVPYCNNYNLALATLDKLGRNSSFRAFIRKASVRYDSHQLPRYVLLLEELLAHTPRAHTDHASLQLAVVKMRAIASDLNEAKREAEMFADVLRVFNSIDIRDRLGIQDLIAPHRRFILEGAVQFRSDEQSQNEPHYLFLFNDLLLIARPKSRNGTFPLVVLLDLANVTAVVALKDSDFIRNCFLIDTPHRSLMLLSQTESERNQWISSLQKCIDGVKDRRATLLRNSKDEKKKKKRPK